MVHTLITIKNSALKLNSQRITTLYWYNTLSHDWKLQTCPSSLMWKFIIPSKGSGMRTKSCRFIIRPTISTLFTTRIILIPRFDNGIIADENPCTLIMTMVCVRRLWLLGVRLYPRKYAPKTDPPLRPVDRSCQSRSCGGRKSECHDNGDRETNYTMTTMMIIIIIRRDENV